jgi:hypothetical protein
MTKRQEDESEEMQTETLNMLPQILGGTVHQQFKRCGKPNCRCANGKLHRAYYHFLRVGGKLRKSYLKTAEVESIFRACLLRRKQEKEQRAHTQSEWQKFRELRTEIRQAGNFSK